MIQNKHIIRLSFIGLFLSVVANILLYRYFIIEEVVLKQITDHNAHIAENYKKQIWNIFPEAIFKIKDNTYRKLLRDQEFIEFANKTSDFLENIDSKVTIYSIDGEKIFTNKEFNKIKIENNKSHSYYENAFIYLDRIFLKNYISKKEINRAFRGQTVHTLISRAVVEDKRGYQEEKSFVNSYIPIINTYMDKFKIEGVVEITSDITDQWDNIVYLEKRIFVAFALVFLIFFVIVMYNTNYAQSIINKQFEANRVLEEAKTKAEMESSSKTEFLANVSHELRTPLNAIIGFSEIILAETYGKIGNQQYYDYVGDINGSGKHLLSVINDILDFSKASADKLGVEKMELDLNKVAAASIRFVKPRADSVSIKLIEDYPKVHIIICADQKRLKQALLNLLSNSVKFTPKDGSITLSIKKNAAKKLVHLIVSDTGIGMNDQDIPKALSSFGQVDNSLSRKYEGTGLGLPLTKKLIELMGGKFDLKSKPGEGTTITMTFKYIQSIDI